VAQRATLPADNSCVVGQCLVGVVEDKMAIGGAYKANINQANDVAVKELRRAAADPTSVDAPKSVAEQVATRSAQQTEEPAPQQTPPGDSYTPLVSQLAKKNNWDIGRLSMDERMTLEFALAQKSGGGNLASSAANVILSPMDAVMGLFK